ncbi:hypothetical protein [Candidatus Palauibacter sp.]|uniref:hypothetical protein n=1 Tax=Candidatus Palauibacter sp. TaxID=3101350 RepID=UPI003C6F672A
MRRLGYASLHYPIAVNQGLTTEVDIGLVPSPLELEPIVATVTRLRRLEIKGFYERKHWGELTGNGYFFTADYIERWRPGSLYSMVAMVVPGIGPDFQNRRMSSGFSDKPCRMRVFLDGIEIRRLGVGVLMIEVAGVEVYKGPASLPAEYGAADARCGAVVIWTK